MRTLEAAWCTEPAQSTLNMTSSMGQGCGGLHMPGNPPLGQDRAKPAGTGFLHLPDRTLSSCQSWGCTTGLPGQMQGEHITFPAWSWTRLAGFPALGAGSQVAVIILFQQEGGLHQHQWSANCQAKLCDMTCL